MRTLSPAVEKIVTDLRERYTQLSGRERLLILGGVAALIVVALAQLIDPIQSVFASQKVELERLEKEIKAMPYVIERHAKLKAKKDAIEEAYKEVEIEEGVYSHIEALIRNFAGIKDAPNIKEQGSRSLGDKYEQLPFLVKFSTNDMGKLVNFLKEAVHGKRPLALSRIQVRKIGTLRLDVELELSSIRRKQQPSTATST